MLAMLADWWRFCRRKDSESATCLVIGLAEYMSERERRQMADYLRELIQADKRRANKKTTAGAGDAA